MSMALVNRNNDLPTPADWQTMLSMAEQLVDSGLLPPHIKTAAAAVAIIQRGRELGIPPSYALNNIVYIQGKATTNSELMLAMVYRDHGDASIQFVATDEARCQIAYKRRGWAEHRTYQFTIDDAKRAGLLTNATWQKYPAAMLRARAISAVARMAFPDTIGGMYTPEELGAQVEMDREGGFVVIVDEDSVDAPALDDVPEPANERQFPDYNVDDHIRYVVAELRRPITRSRLAALEDEIERAGIGGDPEIAGLLKDAQQRRDAKVLINLGDGKSGGDLV